MNTQRRLTRSVIDKKIAGVCAGLARYMGVDVTVLRIIFLISLFFWRPRILDLFDCVACSSRRIKL